MSTDPERRLDTLHHVAIPVQSVAETLDWYRTHFRCDVEYQDDTWALLRFENMSLALVVPDQHPPHIGFTSVNAGRFGPLTPHRDGTRSIYIRDPAGNSVEILDRESRDGKE